MEAEPQTKNAGTPDEASRPRVLVIDDDPATLHLVHAVLEARGYETFMASSAEHALAILDSTRDILIAISDINMSGMDGIMFLERLESRSAEHPAPGVIFLTAYPRVDFAVAALRLGALDFLTKPVRPRELLQAVSKAAERVRRSRAAAQSPEQLANLTRQVEALATALKDWSPLQPRAETGAPQPSMRKLGTDNARDFALLGIEQVRRLRRTSSALSELDDVAWNILLELARAEQSGHRLSVSSLCVSIENVSSTTALRRLQELVTAGHVTRVPDPADARRDFVMLETATQATIDQYLERVGQELAAVAHSS